jgi:hypothetical protein
MEDQVLREIWRIKDKYAARFRSVRALFAHLRAKDVSPEGQGHDATTKLRKKSTVRRRPQMSTKTGVSDAQE